MIGIKKYNISFLEEQEEQIGEEANTQNAKFIFYSDNKFTKQIELCVILNSMNTIKVLVVVDKASTIDYLCIKIAEAYDQYPEFKNLEGLKASKLSKKNDQGHDIPIPDSGNLQDYTLNGDIIYCNLTTNEYWIKALISMSKSTLNCNKLSMMIEMKVRLDMPFRKFKLMIMKCALNCWLENMKIKKDTYHYSIANITFKLPNENDFFNINSAKADKIDSQSIGQLFDFKSEINCNIVFISLEEMMMNELKAIKPEVRDENAMRWNEFLEVQFSDLSSNKKYDPEYSYIVKYIKRMIIKEQEILQSSCYLFYKNDKKINNIGRDSDHDHEDLDRFKVSLSKELLSIIVFDSSYFLCKTEKEKEKKNIKNNDDDDIMCNEKELNSSMPYFIFPNKMEILASEGEEEENNDDISNNIITMSNNIRKRKDSKEDIYQFKHDKAFKKIAQYRDTSKLSNLRNDFKKFDNNHFLKKIIDSYKISIEKGILEYTAMPEFRNYNVLGESENYSNRKQSIKDLSTEELIKWNNITIIIFISLLILLFIFITVLVFSIDF